MANLLFSSGFEGNVNLASVSNGWQSIVGTDAQTGSTWPGSVWGGGTRIQVLANNTGNIANRIETLTGHTGAQTEALRLDVNAIDLSYTQSALILEPGREPTGDIYISQWVKLDANLAQTLGTGGWIAPFGEWKSVDDFRVVTAIQVDNSGDAYWAMKWDNNRPGQSGYQVPWSADNKSVDVPLGEWMKVEFFTHRGNGDGQTWLKVNGQTVFDHVGDNIGVNNDPINRIFLANAYGSKPVEVLVDDIQIWDGVPTGGTAPSSPPPSSGGSSPTPPTSGSGPTPISTTVGSGSDTLILRISQDAYNGDAQYTISVDGKQVGGTLTAKALHALGQSDTITVKGDWAAGSHSVSVNFLNDAYGGSASTDRNLYVDSGTYNGAAVGGAKLTLLSAGTQGFQVTDGTAVSVSPSPTPAPTPAPSPTGTTINGTQGADSLNGGSGNEIIKGGDGNDTISGGGGNDWIEGGRGHEKLTGGAGADTFAFQRGDGWDWISDFARGTDKLRMIGMNQSDVSWTAKAWPGVGNGLEVVYNNGADGGVFLLNVGNLSSSDFIF